MKASVFCVTDSRNYGDFLQTFLTAKLLKDAGFDVTIRMRSLLYYGAMSVMSEKIPVKGFPKFSFLEEKSDLSVVAGHTTGFGTQEACIETYSKALKLGKVSLIFPLSVTKIELHKTYDTLWKKLRQFDIIYTRGLYSYALLESRGFSNIDVALDTGFSLRKVYPKIKANNEGDRLRVAIVPRKEFYYIYGWHDHYVKYLRTLKVVSNVLEKYGAEITLVPFSFGYTIADESAVQDLITFAGFKDNVLKTFLYKVEDLYRKFSEFDLVITSRLHAGIMAMSAGVPTIIVLPRDEQKTIEVLDYLGLEEIFFEEMLYLETLPRKVEYIVENLSEVKRTVNDAVERKIEDVMKPIRWIESTLKV